MISFKSTLQSRTLKKNWAIAIPSALKAAGLKVDGIDFFEINEKLQLDPRKVYVNGGTMAIGHPLGATRARCVATLLHEMKRRGKDSRFGVVSMCIAGDNDDTEEDDDDDQWQTDTSAAAARQRVWQIDVRRANVMLPRMKKMQRPHDQIFHGNEVTEIYQYEELLSRVFHILRENNLELAGDRRRTVIRPPQVLREGNKKTVFVNFINLCLTSLSKRDWYGEEGGLATPTWHILLFVCLPPHEDLKKDIDDLKLQMNEITELIRERYQIHEPPISFDETKGSDDDTKVIFDEEKILRQQSTAQVIPPPLAYTPPLPCIDV
ncbi:3-ketoacyl-CoA thiolase 2, peroxisomal-like protein [Tanacetum coccineum]